MTESRKSIRVAGIIPAAGAGKRMRASTPKQFLAVGEKPVLAYTLDAFERARLVHGVIVVVPEHEIEFCKDRIVATYGLKKVVSIVAGGKRRQDSVRMGLESTGGRYQMVVIHDGVRPFVKPHLIDTVVETAMEYRAAVAGIPARDTIKMVNSSGIIDKTLQRETIWLAQTPQAFYYDDLAKAHQMALAEDWGELTDDSAFVEKMGIPVKMVMGSEENIKITTPADLEVATLLARKSHMVGYG